MQAKLNVYVLGAGCSFEKENGYPLAAGCLQSIKNFATDLGVTNRCPQIRAAVGRTARLLEETAVTMHRVTTTDQLTELILKGSCDDVLSSVYEGWRAHVVGLRYHAVREVKIAIAACFLETEKAVVDNLAGKYLRFVKQNILHQSGPSDHASERLRRSTARVLSFNYDRMFELGFFAALGDPKLKHYGAYSSEVLNSGLDPFGQLMDIDKERFSFLKLHGSVGLRCIENTFGQQVYQIGDVADWSQVKLADELFFAENYEPLIAFPYEKDFILSRKANKLTFRDYIDRTWDHANYVFERAAEIWVIGYSFDPTDAEYLLRGLRRARDCQRIIIQNLPDECARIKRELMIRHRISTRIDEFPAHF